MTVEQSGSTIKWLRVLGLATLQGAITMSWTIYNLYLPGLLAQFGFPEDYTRIILIIENSLAVVVEPVVSGLSDHTYRWLNSRFPFIVAGVTLGAVSFIAIPGVTFFISPDNITQWVLPVILIFWVLAMTTFRSPSLVLLSMCASNKDLPRAASVITLMTGLFISIRPISREFILDLGPMAAFTIGSVMLMLGAFVLYQLFPKEKLEADPEAEPTDLSTLKPLIPALALIFVAGAGGAWGFRFSVTALNKTFTNALPDYDISLLMFGFFVVLAFAALPAGYFATKVGNSKAMLMGIGAAVLMMLAFGLTSSTAIFAILLLSLFAGLNMTLNGAVPFALSLMSKRWGGFGIGMYFGGFTFGATWFVGIFVPLLPAMSATMVAVIGGLAFGVAWLAIATSQGLLVENPRPLWQVLGVPLLYLVVLCIGFLLI